MDADERGRVARSRGDGTPLEVPRTRREALDGRAQDRGAVRRAESIHGNADRGAGGLGRRHRAGLGSWAGHHRRSHLAPEFWLEAPPPVGRSSRRSMPSLWSRVRLDPRQRSRCSLRVACVLTMLFAGIARETPAEASANVSVELLSERAAIEPGMPFRVGLLMRMRPGWHTYWKNPGDSGLPLRVTWNLPEGFSAGPIDWPTPERIPENGLMSYGYSRDVLIPIEITPPEFAQAWANRDRKSTRLNSSHSQISYAVFCLKKKKKNKNIT